VVQRLLDAPGLDVSAVDAYGRTALILASLFWNAEAVGVMLPHVIRFNSEDAEVAAIYEALYRGDLPGRLQVLLRKAKMPTKIRSYGMKRKDLPELAVMASKQWTAQFNPRAVSVDDFEGLYRSAF
jgi:alcohol dehydrogenase